ncbi:SO2930 family diheme c-type cytochrome [Sphingomonas sp. 28-63-12]|uniref:SO2930 family diheme c-type cytochrome n=1 Tax=Sphingomonas sp. 28-63-12 TaxID=1970434 RepID=UPI0035A8F995
MIRYLLALIFALSLAACAGHPGAVTFHAEDNPQSLADWGVFDIKPGHIAPRPGMVTYELATPLFSDYAQKWRMVFVPKGMSARYDPVKTFDFPVGTIIAKTFYYSTPTGAAPGTSAHVLKVTPASYQSGVTGLDLTHARLIETRLLVKRAGGWEALPYVWNAEQTEATLQRTGAEIPLQFADAGKLTAFTYNVPNVNQCAGCHAVDRSRKLMPIGPKARHLNRDFPGIGGEINQLRRLAMIGYLTGAPDADAAPRDARFADLNASIDARARAYLDINCAHCHSATGPARVSGLWLDSPTTDLRKLGACKPPIAAGTGTGNRAYGIVPGHPEKSIMAYRLASDDPGEMMPENGPA